MSWRKLGKIFDPRDHDLPSGCREFAQSPQALVMDDRVRIYFSTRSVDPLNGKYLSHVAFAEFSKDFRRVLGVNKDPVLPLGAAGTFDEHGIFPLSVLRVNGSVVGYTTGWSRRVSVSVETGIGLVRSDDGGRTFRRHGEGPVLAASLREPFLVGDGFVLQAGGKFHMWYIFGTDWKVSSASSVAERVYKIGHAISHDGVSWTKEEGRRQVPDVLGEDECQALPTVAFHRGQYHMYFCYREAFGFRTGKGLGYRIGHATSNDLETWVRDSAPQLGGGEGEWDGEMQCYPSVFEMDGSLFALYNGNSFGRHGFGLAVME